MKQLVLIFAFILFTSCASETEPAAVPEAFPITVLPSDAVYTAGDAISLQFKTEAELLPKLIIRNAYASAILVPEKKKGVFTFKVPKNISRKSGVCSWALVANGTAVGTGSFDILPNTGHEPTLETYFGPRSITAGVTDYSMLVCIATDSFDNVFPSGTEVLFRSQFLNNISETNVPSEDFISWKNIYTTKKSGRILVNNSLGNITSKELTTIVFAANAEPFLISAQRNHDFADGNQILTLGTSVIRDKYDNIVSDGTMVNFSIKNSKGAVLNSSATTIAGMAKANLLHPSEKELWQVTAYVTGAAKSNTIALNFNTAIEDFEVSFSADKRTITVGTLRSFMQQLVPDGILIQLEVSSASGEHLETIIVTSIKGLGTFKLRKEYYPDATYHLELKAAGIVKPYDVTLDGK